MSVSASSVLFGFDFQTNAAIVLMLENMAEMKSIRVEGDEDIEIQLNDNSFVLAQAKSVVNSNTDFKNVRSKAKQAVLSLSRSSYRLKARELVYITNSPNPFNQRSWSNLFSLDAHVHYNSLPDSLKSMILGWLDEIENPLDTGKLKIQVLPFDSDDDQQKYKFVIQSISDFIGKIDINTDGLRGFLHEVWTNALNRNGTRKDTTVTLQKKAMVWPIIVFVTGRGRLNRDALYCNMLDDSEYDEVIRLYREAIDSYSERYEFTTKVLSDFNATGIKGRDSLSSFIDQHWEDYYDDIGDEMMDQSVRCSLIKIILSNILNKRIDINKIKRAVKL